MPRTAWLAPFVLVGCSSAALGAHPADVSLRDLASAFRTRDTARAHALILDGWSGSRFWSEWPPEEWQRAANELENATLLTDSPTERVYTVRRASGAREITVALSDGHWRLDYNSFAGPFPHP